MTDETDRGDDIKDLTAPEQEVEQEVKTEEVKAEGEVKAEEAKPEPAIPKSRFDEAVRKEREEKAALAARVKEFEERDAQAAVVNDFAEAQKMVKDMIKQHTSLLADGELDKASDLMEKILDLNQAISERKSDAKAFQAKDMAKEEVKYDALVAKLEADYPQINPEDESYDKEVVANIQALMGGYMQSQRMSASAALAKAVKTLMPPQVKATEKAADAGIRRKEAAVAKALDAKGKQPASNKDVGIDHDKEGGALDASAVMKMSWEEFVKLPESKLSELRGDFVS